jgi:hypothetical protein
MHRARGAGCWRLPGGLAVLWTAGGQEHGTGDGRGVLSVFVDWLPYLVAGERGTIMVIAADRRQARTIWRYARAMLRVPLLAALVERQTEDTLDLTNGVTIEIAVASFRSVRGYTLIAALCDEVAFWRTDEGSSNPDAETIAALRLAMATIPGALLLCASSPYARRGTLWTTFRRHFGRTDSPVLVWRASTKVMNPTVPESVIAEAYEDDPASAAAEYGAEFRSDVETFVSREVVDAAVVPGRHELPPMAGKSYLAFVDPSGGSADSMTLAITHRAGDRVVLDAVRERRPPFSPDDVVIEFSGLLKAYSITDVHSDRYGGGWPAERFLSRGIRYVPSEKPKSDLYRDMLPLLNSGRVELLDVPRLAAQLTGLERRTARGGRDSIDHAPGAHDDVANAVAGAMVLAVSAHRPVWTRELLAGIIQAPPYRPPSPSAAPFRFS